VPLVLQRIDDEQQAAGGEQHQRRQEEQQPFAFGSQRGHAPSLTG
jgi:hypothetical protein